MSLPTKRSASASATATATTGTASTSASNNFLPMKKAKSQAASTCSPLDHNKNGLHHSEDVVFDPSSMSLDDDPKLVDYRTPPATANLSRKKATPPQPAKKLVIKLVKAKPTLPTNFEEDTWAKLQSAINAIFLKQPAPCDLEKLYQAVNDLCLHKMGGSLYMRIEKECEAHISAALQALVGQSPDLVVFLKLVEECWHDLCDQMLMIRSIALYLDRTYVKQTPTARSLWDMGLQLFRKHLSLSPEVEHKTVTGLLRMIERERLGETVNRKPLGHLLKMFTSLGIYAESFEIPFLECTSEFYAAEGMAYMQQSDVPDYLKHVESRLNEEQDRCKIYLDTSTKKPLIATAERQLLERHISAILDKGFMMLMDGHRIEDLKRIYSLFLRVNALESLRQALSMYIRRTGQGLVMDEEKDKDMVSSLLEFKASLDSIWEESFSKNEGFCITIKDAFEHLINLRQVSLSFCWFDLNWLQY
ncbi:CULLIN-4A [Salix purpurea]|uniref:CULLIN-4A n=1 Tax=Salix purpurea TaxID=77065 RepID=A0A9Q1ACD1_SALPP|nr:CULLIN-4A [Salix purpurea]